jgi:inner membrane protein
LSLLYGYLYLLLRLEDYALLAGSIGVFLALAIVMFLTRRVNWYELRLGATEG